jgi:Tfp pilus assembly protein PilE
MSDYGMMSSRQRHAKGLTIVQLMIILGIIGIVATVVVDLVIEKRCAEEPAAMLCKDHAAPRGK